MKKGKTMRILTSLLLVIELIVNAVSPAAMAASTAVKDKTFSDVKPGSWYYEHVMEMTREGVLSGYTDGTFKPNGTVTGGEFLAMVGMRKNEYERTGQISHWAAGWMQLGLEEGWYDWDEFPPTAADYNRKITRQVAVKILMKAFLPDARGDYNDAKSRITDFDQLSGRYYDTVFAAYAVGVVSGMGDGRFAPNSTLTRAQAASLVRLAGNKAGYSGARPDDGNTDTPATPQVTRRGGVSENGWLQVKGTQLCNEKGEAIVLRGMSTHGMQWYGDFANKTAMASTAEYGANLFRIAMYTGENGYISQPDAIKKKVTAAVDAAIENDMYVIIDWHILSDGNPKTYQSEAKKFFAEMAKKYKDSPAVIFEVCNEPNGGVSWSDVKSYATEMVKTIRDAGSKAVILIGSPTWSQDIHLAAADPVKGENLMYTLHFYAGTHGQDLRNRISDCLKKGLPVFVSEWGTSRADGSGGVFISESKTWLDFLDKNKISWANWSLCDKSETSAALKPGASRTGPWKESDMTDSGKFVFSRFK